MSEVVLIWSLIGVVFLAGVVVAGIYYQYCKTEGMCPEDGDEEDDDSEWKRSDTFLPEPTEEEKESRIMDIAQANDVDITPYATIEQRRLATLHQLNPSRKSVTNEQERFDRLEDDYSYLNTPIETTGDIVGDKDD